ncbi:MAG: cytochrome b N-terminal domain-containing protein [Methanosarcinales archaeon]
MGILDRTYTWLDERFELTPILEKQLYSKRVPKHALNPIYCFGGITLVTFVMQVLSGILLAMYYKPTPETAHSSIEFIMTEIRYGAYMRSLHFWGANLMIVFIFLHMIRVYFTAAYKKPRELNWVVGCLLLAVTLTFGFSGYLLPWDQIAYWATTVGTEMAGAVPVFGHDVLIMLRGGPLVSEYTLNRFYALHVLVLPIILAMLLSVHFIMIRIQGISGEL